MKAVIIGFDGLQPDLIDPELTPNFSCLRQAEVFAVKHRTGHSRKIRKELHAMRISDKIDLGRQDSSSRNASFANHMRVGE